MLAVWKQSLPRLRFWSFSILLKMAPAREIKRIKESLRAKYLQMWDIHGLRKGVFPTSGLNASLKTLE